MLQGTFSGFCSKYMASGTWKKEQRRLRRPLVRVKFHASPREMIPAHHALQTLGKQVQQNSLDFGGLGPSHGHENATIPFNT